MSRRRVYIWHLRPGKLVSSTLPRRGSRTHFWIDHVWCDIEELWVIDELIEFRIPGSARRGEIHGESLQVECEDWWNFGYSERLGCVCFGLTAETQVRINYDLIESWLLTSRSCTCCHLPACPPSHIPAAYFGAWACLPCSHPD